MIVTKTFPTAKTINHVFDELFKTFPNHPASENNMAGASVNITEIEHGYNLAFNAPGRNKEEFKISVENALLTVKYEKATTTEPSEQKFVRKEFSTVNFKRSFNLDDKLNADGIEAKYENGILNVFIPKKAEEKITPKQISIQ